MKDTQHVSFLISLGTFIANGGTSCIIMGSHGAARIYLVVNAKVLIRHD